MTGHANPDPESWLDALPPALAAHARAVLVVVTQVSGSAPRESGAAMIVTRDALAGTIGGGQLEHEATRIAREALAQDDASTFVVRFPLAARVGQCCGGVATLAFAVIERPARAWLDVARTCVRAGAAFALVGRIGSGAAAQPRLVVTTDDARGSLGSSALDSAAVTLARARLAAGTAGALLLPLPGERDASLVVHLVRPDPFPVRIFGNGHVARALVQVLGVLPAQVRWIDAREDDFPAHVPPNVEIVASDVPEAELREAPPGTYALVMTHSHALDFALVETALARADWRYLGMIGSRAKRAQLLRRLAARGVPADRIALVTCPIGHTAPGIDGKTPGAIALAVALQLCAVRAARADAPASLGRA
jgi:xanthine dehydrogenase accessory factor